MYCLKVSPSHRKILGPSMVIMKEEWVLCGVHLCGPLWQYRPQYYSVAWWTLFLSQCIHELFRGKSFPILICEELLHDVVIGVWCAMSATSVIVPIHFLSHTGMLHTFWTVMCGGGGVCGGSNPPPPKFRRPSKIVPNSTRLWKLLKIAEFRTPTPQDIQKKGSRILKLPRFAIVLH
jgi:hypothetical protein